MAQDIGGNIGQRIASLAYMVSTRSSSIALGIVTKTDLEKVKVDVKLKTRKGDNVVEYFSCPVVSQSYQGGAQINIPKVGDLVVVLFSKYNIDLHLKTGTTKIDDADEINVKEQNYAIIIGTILSPPELPDLPPRTVPSGIEKGSLPSTPPKPPFNRDPIYHDKDQDWAKKFIKERLEPAEDHQIWYHPYDHEIRMTRHEIHLKHRTGTQIIFRTTGDLEMFIWGKWFAHAKGDIILESESVARMLSYVPPKERPWRLT